MASDYFLNLYLNSYCSSLCSCIADTGILRDYRVNDYLVFIIAIQVSYNLPQAGGIKASIPGTFLVFIRVLEAEFVLYRYVSNHLKKIVK